MRSFFRHTLFAPSLTARVVVGHPDAFTADMSDGSPIFHRRDGGFIFIWHAVAFSADLRAAVAVSSPSVSTRQRFRPGPVERAGWSALFIISALRLAVSRVLALPSG